MYSNDAMGKFSQENIFRKLDFYGDGQREIRKTPYLVDVSNINFVKSNEPFAMVFRTTDIHL